MTADEDDTIDYWRQCAELATVMRDQATDFVTVDNLRVLEVALWKAHMHAGQRAALRDIHFCPICRTIMELTLDEHGYRCVNIECPA
jgi:hypothetical protein